MKTTALIAAAALAFGSAAFAQQDHRVVRSDDTRADQHEHAGDAGQKMRNGMHRLGEKTRNAMHRLGEKLHAHRDDRNDTHAMGAAGEDHARRQRMDEAYGHWHDKQDKAEQKR